MALVTRRELLALLGSLLAAALGWRALVMGLDAGDARRKALRAIRADADPTRDLVVFTDDAVELVASAAPLPAVGNLPQPPADLAGFRRLYAVAPSENLLAGYLARLGTPSASFGASGRRWDLAGLATVTFDLAAHLLDATAVNARREGGAADGACEASDTLRRCHSPDDWNHLRVDEHPIGGVNLRCVFAHPQADGRLVIEVPGAPAARNLVGMVGIDDRAFTPNGAAVTNTIRFVPTDGSAPATATVVAPNRVGATPYRLALGGRAGALSFTITTPNAGARSYCFTAFLTE